MKEDKKGKASLIIIIFIMFACIATLLWLVVTDNQDIDILGGVKPNIENMSYEIKAVVVKANEYDLYVILSEGEELCQVSYAKEGNIGFKQGQEILIHCDGTILETYPAQITKVEKIEIQKEESDIQIPKEVLQYCYGSNKNGELTHGELE